ncbi:hypothetical protein D3C72_2003750 [compost metagenome]
MLSPYCSLYFVYILPTRTGCSAGFKHYITFLPGLQGINRKETHTCEPVFTLVHFAIRALCNPLHRSFPLFLQYIYIAISHYRCGTQCAFYISRHGIRDFDPDCICSCLLQYIFLYFGYDPGTFLRPATGGDLYDCFVHFN